jgi:hypothetical protein
MNSVVSNVAVLKFVSRPAALQAKPGGADRDRTDDLKLAKLPLSQLSYGPDSNCLLQMVGPGRVERPTSRLSGVRSNHLSYEPERGLGLQGRRRPLSSDDIRAHLRGYDGKEGKRRGRQVRHFV